MPELDYLILADGATQRPDGKLDIYGAGFDTVFAPVVPARHPQLAIVLRLLLSPHEAESDHHLELVLMSEDGPELARARAEVNAAPDEVREQVEPGDKMGIGAVLNLAGVVFPNYGRYHLAVLWEGTELRQPLRLRVMPVEAAGSFGGDPPAST